MAVISSLIGRLIISAVAAAGLALAANLGLKRTGTRGVAFFGPVLEEGLKTGSALFFAVPVPATHILFGVLEAAWDLFRGGGGKIPAALAGVAVHTIFGLVTYFLISAGLSAYTAVLAAAAAHVAWNSAVIRFSR